MCFPFKKNTKNFVLVTLHIRDRFQTYLKKIRCCSFGGYKNRNFNWWHTVDTQTFNIIKANVIIGLTVSKTSGLKQMYSNYCKNDQLMGSLFYLRFSNFKPISSFLKSDSLLHKTSQCIRWGYHDNIFPSVKADSGNFEIGNFSKLLP